MDPEVSGRSNPYGAEAYKDVAIEIIEALGRSPRAMIVPTAGGDTIYGVAKGFAAAHDQLGTRMPKVIAVQPRSANSLERSLKIGTTVNVPRAKSVALSLSDERVGRQGLLALQRWHGSVVSVSEKAIKEATRDFARAGFLLEPASAATLAGYRQALNKHLVTPADSVVLLATASGAKWAASLPGMYGNGRFTTRKAVLRALKEVG
jgi:threonine synthase